MSNPNEPTSHDTPELPTPEEILRVVLGQASAEESRRIRETMHPRAKLGDLKGAMRAGEQAVREFNALGQPALVLARIDEASAGLAAGLAPGLAPAPALRGDHDSHMASFAADGLRLDAEGSRNADGSYLLRMQLDTVESGSLAAEFAVLDRQSGWVVASGMLDDDGAARVAIAADAIPARMVEIAIHRGGRTVLAAEVPLG